MESTPSSALTALADYTALIYHEARNVRHLIKAGHLPGAPWSPLTNLPANRHMAWQQIQPTRTEARSFAKPSAVLDAFQARFGASLEELLVMYRNPNWKHAKAYGGNAWAAITEHVISLADAISRSDHVAIESPLSKLATTSHNTGALADKLRNLDEEGTVSGLPNVSHVSSDEG